jgi:hypothetical protein
MDDSSDKSEGEKLEPQAAAPPAGDSNLPVVWSPKLDAGEAAAAETLELDADEAAPPHDEAADEPAAAPAAPSRSGRFALLAATVALAAALGALIGAMSASGIQHFMAAPTAAAAPGPSVADAGAVLHAMKSELAELSAMKTSLDGAVRNANTQFAAIADRLDRVERVAADPAAAAKLAHIADTVDRLDKLNATPETTSSIAVSTPSAEPKITDRILQDWVVQDVHGDRALVESRYGGVFDVGAGSMLPGLGRVDAVKRQDGQWVVVTARGMITSGR